MVLILGAGPAQTPLVERARARGLRTVVVGGRPGEPGLALADQAVVMDLRDGEGLLALARRIQPAAVCTVGTDVPVPALGALVHALGLPGPGLEATRLCSNKVEMKKRFQERGVPCAPSVLVDSLQAAEGAWRELGGVAMLKIPDGAGSKGVTRLEHPEDLPGAWAYARSVSRAPLLLLEPCLVGPEVGITAMVSGGEVRFCLPYNDTVLPGPHPTPVGHSLPFAHPELRLPIEAVVHQAVAALEADQTLLNVDLILTAEGPRVLEVAVRLGATCMGELMARHTGVDPLDLALDLALGREPEGVHLEEGEAWAALLLRAPRSGTLRCCEDPEALAQDPRCGAVRWDHAPGAVVQGFRSGQDRIGEILARGATWQEAEAACEELSARLRVEVH